MQAKNTLETAAAGMLMYLLAQLGLDEGLKSCRAEGLLGSGA